MWWVSHTCILWSVPCLFKIYFSEVFDWLTLIENLKGLSSLCERFHLYFIFSPKVRFDPVKMLIVRNDKHFADSGSHNYGSATTCCPSMGAKCKHTWFRINLSGTGLRLNKQVRWEATGRAQIDWEQTIDGRINFISCKGSCGECSPSDSLSLSIIGC